MNKYINFKSLILIEIQLIYLYSNKSNVLLSNTIHQIGSYSTYEGISYYGVITHHNYTLTSLT